MEATKNAWPWYLRVFTSHHFYASKLLWSLFKKTCHPYITCLKWSKLNSALYSKGTSSLVTDSFKDQCSHRNGKPLHQVSQLTRNHFKLEAFHAIILPTIQRATQKCKQTIIWSRNSQHRILGRLEGDWRGDGWIGEVGMMATNT